MALSFLAVLGCSTPILTPPLEKPAIAFRRLPDNHVGRSLVIPVQINGVIPAHFIFDTGMGMNFISRAFCKKISCEIDGSYDGKRITGKSTQIPLARLRSIGIGGFRLQGADVGVLDTSDYPYEFRDVDGFISLSFFKNLPFTIDYQAGLIWLETKDSLASRMAQGIQVPVRVDQDGPLTDIFTSLSLGADQFAEVEVATGTDALILHHKYIKKLGLKLKAIAKTAQIPGPVYPRGIPALSENNLNVVFKKMFYDGKIGDDFLSKYAVTFDLPHARLIFSNKKGG